MILQSLLLFALLRVSNALSLNACPAGSACLHHASCTFAPPKEGSSLMTMEAETYKGWKKGSCSGSTRIGSVELFIQPLSNRRWNIKVEHDQITPEIRLGDSLTFMVNQSEAIFNTTFGDTIKIPVVKKGDEIQFFLDSPKKSLLEIFNEASVTFVYDNATASGNELSSVFWKKLLELTPPCNSSLIIDHCNSNSTNCTILQKSEELISCQNESKLWVKSENVTWVNLKTVTCVNETKDWTLTNEEGVVATPSGEIELRCAAEMPKPLPREEEKESTKTPKGETTAAPDEGSSTKENSEDETATESADGSSTVSHPTTAEPNLGSSILHTILCPFLLFFVLN